MSIIRIRIFFNNYGFLDICCCYFSVHSFHKDCIIFSINVFICLLSFATRT